MNKVLALVTALVAILLLAVPIRGQSSSTVRATHIIVFNEGVDVEAAAQGLTRAFNLRPTHTYRHAIKGMAAVVPEGRLTGLMNDPRVAYVEADQEVQMFAQNMPTGIRRIFANTNSNLDMDGADDMRVDVDVAVIDTGVDLDHPDLNVVSSTDCASGGPFSSTCMNGQGDDGNGHGSHVAGTIGALDNGLGVVGVAPGARLWSVRVLDNNGSGYMSWIIAGIDWVTAHAATIEVANMSLGCECTSSAMNTAISNSVAAGVTYAVAAGNSDKDSSTFSPANHPDVITVSALADFDGVAGALGSPTCRTDQDDTLADFSNWGSLVEIAAPGVCIYSTWMNGGYNTISGTSMASPHVAGAAAVLAASGSYTPSQVRTILMSQGNLNWTDDSGDGVKEMLLDVSNTTVFAPAMVSNDGGSTPAPSPTPVPSTEITLTASGYKVKGYQRTDLNWNGATSTNVDVFRNGARITTTTNDGFYTDNINKKGSGSYTYKVCEAGTSTCSNEAKVIF
jgi:subtilisin family serine protease